MKQPRKKPGRAIFTTLVVAIYAALAVIQILILRWMWANGVRSEGLGGLFVYWLPLIVIFVLLCGTNIYVRQKMTTMEVDETYYYRRSTFGLWYTVFSDARDKRHGTGGH